MKKKEFEAIREQLTRFAESNKEHNSVLLIVGGKGGQTALCQGSGINIAACLGIAMHSDEQLRMIVKGAVDAYDNMLAGKAACYKLETDEN